MGKKIEKNPLLNDNKVEFSSLEPINEELVQEVNKYKTEYAELINKKVYSSKDTGLSYRQINCLSNILQDKKKTKSAWREFTFKELLYIKVIQELKNYGLIEKKLVNLQKAFFDKKYKALSNLFIVFLVFDIKVHIVVDPDFNIKFLDTFNFHLFYEDNHNSYINLNLNKIFLDLHASVKKENYQEELYKKNYLTYTDYAKKGEEMINEYIAASEDEIKALKEYAGALEEDLNEEEKIRNKLIYFNDKFAKALEEFVDNFYSLNEAWQNYQPNKLIQLAKECDLFTGRFNKTKNEINFSGTTRKKILQDKVTEFMQDKFTQVKNISPIGKDGKVDVKIKKTHKIQI